MNIEELKHILEMQQDKRSEYFYYLLDNTPENEWVYCTHDKLEVTVNKRKYEFIHNQRTCYKLPREISNAVAIYEKKKNIKRWNMSLAQQKRREKERLEKYFS